MLNDSNHYLFYSIIIKYSDKYINLDADKTEPNTMIKIDNFTREKINNTSEIIVQVLFYGNKQNIIKKPIEKLIKIQPVKFFSEGVFKPNDFFDEDAYIFLLHKDNDDTQIKNDKIDTENLRQELKSEKNHNSHFISRNKKNVEILKIDLHINKLIDSVVGISNLEILEIQMEHFHKSLTNAIEQKVEKVVFIHGIGNGSLKNKIRESLALQYKLHFEDASFKDYGFGATMVIIPM